MNTRRDFLKFGALFVPAAIAAPRVAYSFLRAPETHTWWEWEILEIRDMAGRILYRRASPPELVLNGHVYCSVKYNASVPK